LHEALPLEGERERGTMPRENPRKGISITWEGTTPGDLEVLWDPGDKENNEHEAKAPPQERPHTLTHIPSSQVPIPLSRRRHVFFKAHREGTRAVLRESKSKSNLNESERVTTRNKPPFGRQTCLTRGHARTLRRGLSESLLALLPAPLIAVPQYVDYVDF
jgi:hypothetical protein